MRKFIFPAGLLLFAVLIFVFYHFNQPVASYQLESRMDGNQYAKIYAYFKSQSPDYEVTFPFHSRILVPFLASLIPTENFISAFKTVNFVFVLLSVASLYWLWQQLQIPDYLKIIGFFWLLFHWSGLIRLNIFDPIGVDVPVYFFETGLLLIIFSEKWLYLLWLSPLATLDKEVFPVFLIVLLGFTAWQYFSQKQQKFPILIIFISLIISLLTKETVNHFFPASTSGSAWVTVWRWSLVTWQHPFRFIRWAVAFFTAYGFLWLGAVRKKQLTISNKQSGEKQQFNNSAIQQFHLTYYPILFLLSCSCLILSFLGGGDFTRLLFIGFPFLMTFILQKLQYQTKRLTVSLLIFSLPFTRIIGQIPDPGTDWKHFSTWYPEYATPEVVLGWSIYIVIALILLFFINKSHIRF